MAKKNNDLLIKNHENGPNGSEPLPEVNEVYALHSKRGKGHNPHCGNGYGRGRGRGRERCSGRERGCNYGQIKKYNPKKPLA